MSKGPYKTNLLANLNKQEADYTPPDDVERLLSEIQDNLIQLAALDRKASQRLLDEVYESLAARFRP